MPDKVINRAFMRTFFKIMLPAVCALAATSSWAASSGSLSGTVKDSSGAVIPGAGLTLVNNGVQTVYKTISDVQGAYTFPSIAVGRYDLTIEATGFKSQKKTNLGIDADAAVRVDIALEVGQQSQQITVSESAAGRRHGSRYGGNSSGRSGVGHPDGGDSVERAELHGSAGDPARRNPGHQPHGDFGHHGGRHREPSIPPAI